MWCDVVLRQLITQKKKVDGESDNTHADTPTVCTCVFVSNMMVCAVLNAPFREVGLVLMHARTK